LTPTKQARGQVFKSIYPRYPYRQLSLSRSYFFALSLLLTAFFSVAQSNKLTDLAVQARFGSQAVTRLHNWNDLLTSQQTRSPIEKIEVTNHFFNSRLHFVGDKKNWGREDYWATPLETLSLNAGDCEDYAIAKYFTLLRLGIPVGQLRLIYVKAQIGGSSSKIFQPHMVLGYYEQPNAVPYILDSLVTTVEAADKRSDLYPIYSFNTAGLWVGHQTEAHSDPTARLSKWRNLLERMKQEGF